MVYLWVFVSAMILILLTVFNSGGKDVSDPAKYKFSKILIIITVFMAVPILFILFLSNFIPIFALISPIVSFFLVLVGVVVYGAFVYAIFMTYKLSVNAFTLICILYAVPVILLAYLGSSPLTLRTEFVTLQKWLLFGLLISLLILVLIQLVKLLRYKRPSDK